MLVKEVMTKKPVTFGPEDKIVDAIQVLKDESINGAPVMDKNKFVGLLTTEDVLDYMEIHDFAKEYAKDIILPIPFDAVELILEMREEMDEIKKEVNKIKKTKVKEIMNKKPVTVGPSMHVSEAAVLMSDKKITHLPVVEEGKLLGLVTRSDLLKSLI